MKNVEIATAYYRAVGRKNVDSIENLLHPDIQVVSPLSKVNGKEKVLQSMKTFSEALNSFTILSKFESGNQAVVVYDTEMKAPIGQNRAVSLLTIDNGLITNIELFFDSVPFKKLTAKSK